MELPGIRIFFTTSIQANLITAGEVEGSTHQPWTVVIVGTIAEGAITSLFMYCIRYDDKTVHRIVLAILYVPCLRDGRNIIPRFCESVHLFDRAKRCSVLTLSIRYLLCLSGYFGQTRYNFNCQEWTLYNGRNAICTGTDFFHVESAKNGIKIIFILKL